MTQLASRNQYAGNGRAFTILTAGGGGIDSGGVTIYSGTSLLLYVLGRQSQIRCLQSGWSTENRCAELPEQLVNVQLESRNNRIPIEHPSLLHMNVLPCGVAANCFGLRIDDQYNLYARFDPCVYLLFDLG